jgi:hypothetical protein
MEVCGPNFQDVFNGKDAYRKYFKCFEKVRGYASPRGLTVSRITAITLRKIREMMKILNPLLRESVLL